MSLGELFSRGRCGPVVRAVGCLSPVLCFNPCIDPVAEFRPINGVPDPKKIPNQLLSVVHSEGSCS